jgi:hypothetical protein
VIGIKDRESSTMGKDIEKGIGTGIAIEDRD